MRDDTTLVQRTGYNILAKIVSTVSLLIVHGYASRTLGPGAFGEGQYLLWIVQIVWVFVNAGLPQALARYLAIDPSAYRSIFFRPSHLILYGSVILVVSFVAGIIVSPGYTLILSFAFAALSTAWLLQSICDGLLLNNIHFRSGAVSNLVMVALAIPVVSMFGLPGYILLFALQAAVYSIIAGFSVCRKAAPPATIGPTVDVRGVIKFATAAWIASIVSSFVWQRMELFFIERSLTMTDVGYFSIGVTLGSTVMQPVTMLSSALIPYFSRYYRDRRERTEAVYVVLTKAFALVSFFVGWYVSFNSAFFVTLIFGKEFESASAVTAIIVAASPLAASTAVGSALQMGEGRAPFIAITSSILAVVSVFCFWYVVPVYGIIGAGAVRALLQCTGIAAGTVYIMRAMHYRFPLGVFLFSITIPMFLHAGLNILFPGQTFWMVALKGALAIPLFGLMAWGVRPFTLAEWTMLREALDNQFQWRRRPHDIS